MNSLIFVFCYVLPKLGLNSLISVCVFYVLCVFLRCHSEDVIDWWTYQWVIVLIAELTKFTSLHSSILSPSTATLLERIIWEVASTVAVVLLRYTFFCHWIIFFTFTWCIQTKSLIWQVLAASQTLGESGNKWFQGTADAVRRFLWLFEVCHSYFSCSYFCRFHMIFFTSIRNLNKLLELEFRMLSIKT